MWNAIDSVVRALGRIVVCVVAALELRTIRISSRLSTDPSDPWPNTAPPSTDSTSPWLLGLPSPIPCVPIPANACTLIVTSR